jgi:hypothetical protein
VYIILNKSINQMVKINMQIIRMLEKILNKKYKNIWIVFVKIHNFDQMVKTKS